MLAALLVISSLVASSSASVQVRKTSKGPTGYEVDFTYFNATAKNVSIGGGFPTFTDSFHTSPDGSAHYNPSNYRPGWFPSNSQPVDGPPYHMKDDGKGNWTYTTPMPSGIYSYSFVVDCVNVTACGLYAGRFDPDNRPFVNVEGDQLQSTFQVPYDAQFQAAHDLDGLDFDFALSAAKEHRGRVFTVNYTSPGSVHPAPDVHDFTIYLPSGYDSMDNRTTYPVLYLSHGGGGDGQDWENMAKASNILDNLIAGRHLLPTVVVMPSFYNLAAEYPLVFGHSVVVQPPAAWVRENYMAYLFPYIEKNYRVSRDPKRRAFSGLSLGSMLTYEMYINATDYFSYFGMFSGVLGPIASASDYINATMLANKPSLAQKGLFSGAGLYDIAFDDTRTLQAALRELDIPFLTRIVPWGFHAWNTWSDALWYFGKMALWQPLPFTDETGVDVK